MNGCEPVPVVGGPLIIDRFPQLSSTKGSKDVILTVQFDTVMDTFAETYGVSPSFEIESALYDMITTGERHTAGTCGPNTIARWEAPTIFRVYVEGPVGGGRIHIVAKRDGFISSSGEEKLAAGTTLWRFNYNWVSTESYDISGTCTGGIIGTYIVGIYDYDPSLPYDSPLTGIDSPLTGTTEVVSAYTVRGLNNGTYYAAAFRDVNGNDRYDYFEPWGEHGSPIDVSGGNVSNIIITVEAQ